MAAQKSSRSIKKTCPVCGKSYFVPKSGYQKKTCSTECSKTLRKQHAEETSLKKYGVKNAGGTKESLEKSKATNLKKYGAESYFASETAKEHNKRVWQEKYGVDNPQKSDKVKEKTKETNLEKYGDTNPLGKKSWKRKEIDEDNLKRYGVTNLGGTEASKKKMKETQIERYGTWYSSSKEGRSKIEQTNMKRYGVKTPFESEKIKQKIRETNIKKYGVPYAMQSDEVKDRITKTLQTKYGVNWACQLTQCREASGSVISSLNKAFHNELQAHGVKTSYEFPIGKYSYDLKIESTNTLIEINPSYTHTCANTHMGNVDKCHHMNKLLAAESAGYRCINVWDWDNYETIIKWLIPKTRVYARKCDIQTVSDSEASIFFNDNHIQGNCRNKNLNLGLYYEGSLVSLMSFGKPRYNNNCEWELLRFCSSLNTEVIGGASKIFNAFVKKASPTSVISYCDRSKFSGKIYQTLKFNEIGSLSPSCHWSKGKRQVTDNLLRIRGYDQLFGTNYGKNTSNKILMLEHGWLPVYDCGQATYIWRAS